MHTVLRAAERADDGNCAKAVRLEDEHVGRRHASTSRWRSWARTHARFDPLSCRKARSRGGAGQADGWTSVRTSAVAGEGERAHLHPQEWLRARRFRRGMGVVPGGSATTWRGLSIRSAHSRRCAVWHGTMSSGWCSFAKGTSAAAPTPTRGGDLRIAMEPAQIRRLARLATAAPTTLLGLWATPPWPHLEDPYGLSPAYFDTCFDIIDSAVERIARLAPRARAQ